MPSKKTFLTVINNTKVPFRTHVEWVDNYDWDSGARPDYNFHNVTMNPGERKVERQEINTWATSNMYTIKFFFPNNEVVGCRIDQSVANRCKGDRELHPTKIIEKALSHINPLAAAGWSLGVDTVNSMIEYHYERGCLEIMKSPHYDAKINVRQFNITIELIERKNRESLSIFEKRTMRSPGKNKTSGDI